MSYIVEVFSGIQGEGPIVGYRQIFVRFSACQLSCKYCDTDFAEKKYAAIELTPGMRDWSDWQNPISADILYRHIVKMNNELRHHSVSLTGGEPLLHPIYLKALTSKLKEYGLQTYLETNGLLYKSLEAIIDNIDIIGMDIKMQSETGEPTNWTEHEEFLSIAKNKDVFVKIVVSSETKIEDIVQAAMLLYKHDAQIPLIFQPVTPVRELQAPTPSQMLDIMKAAMEIIPHVRVIPQTHVMLQQQ